MEDFGLSYGTGVLTDYSDGRHISIHRYFGVSVMHVPHIHTGYELYFCPENITQRSVICGVEYTHTFPSAIISKPFTIHSMSCLEDCESDFKRYVFYFDSSILKSLGIDLFPSGITDGAMAALFRLPTSEAEQLSHLIDSALDLPGELSEGELGAVFSLLVSKLYSYCGREQIIGVGDSDFYISSVLRYMTENFSANLTIEGVARHFSVSLSKLNRDFRSALGASPKIFLENVRLCEAKYLLLNTDLSIPKVSLRCGFLSENYFYRFFKAHIGITPCEYRRKKNKKEL